MAESPSSAHMRYHQPLPINCDFTQNMKHDQQHFSSNHDCDGVGSMFGVELSGIDANFANGMGESCDKKVGINSRERRELRQRENISVEKDGHGLSMFVKRREYCAPHLFEKMPKSDELCNTVRINSVLMSTHDKDGRTEELNVESYLGAESYDGHSQRVKEQIGTDSDEKYGGNELVVSAASDGNTPTLLTDPSLLNSPARVNFGISVGGDNCKMIEESHNCKLGTSLGAYKLVNDALKYGGGSKEHQQNVQSPRLGCTYMETQLSPLVSYLTPQAGCIKLRHYIEGSKKSTHCVMHLCFSVFDKKVRDKGSGHPLLMDEHLSLSFADKFEKWERNARMMCDDIWRRWKSETHAKIASEGNANEFNSFVREGQKCDNEIVMCSAYTQSEAKLWQWLISCHCAT